MTLQQALEWYNLVFELPFLAALLYLFMLASGLGSVEHDSDADADIDGDVGVDHDAALETDHSVEHIVGDHAHHDVDSHHPSLMAQALSFLGIGKVPLSLIGLSFAFIWGFTGFVGNQVFVGILRVPELAFWPALGGAGLCAVFGTRYIARGIARIMPSTETFVSSNSQLVGKRAEVRYTLTAGSGTVLVYDRFKSLLEREARVPAGEENIPAGAPVVLVGYDRDRECFIVRRDPLGGVGLRGATINQPMLSEGREDGLKRTRERIEDRGTDA